MVVSLISGIKLLLLCRVAKCTGAQERRSKEAGVLQRKPGLNLISKGVCIC